MTCHIIGCGPSGSLWDGSGYSIGVNDCEKFGRPVDALIVVNESFSPERRKVIENTEAPDGFWSHLDCWNFHKNYKPFQSRYFHNRIDPNIIYHQRTTPFIAMSMAHYRGFKEIVLWGCDFINHSVIREETLEYEKDAYLRFISLLEMSGVRVYLGASMGVFEGFILVWPKPK